MGLAILLALQASAYPALSAPPAIDFDLARLARADLADPLRTRGCGRQEADTILVCGRRSSGGAYPMAEMERLFATRPLLAETRLARNLTGDVHVESVALPQGATSNRIMVRLTFPF
jgi:hypothetical protein